MFPYITALAIALCALILLVLFARFLWRACLDLYDLTIFLFVARKNYAEHKKYKEEKAKNLEKEKQLRLEQLKAKGLNIEPAEVSFEELEEAMENPELEKKYRWRSKIFKERRPLLAALRNLLNSKAIELEEGTKVPIWQIRVRSSKEASRDKDRGQYM